MEKQLINQKLKENYSFFVDYINSLTTQELVFAKPEKWTAAQQLQHLITSVKPIRQALSLPKFVLKMLIGKANRTSKSYDELVAKYQLKLQNGGRAPARFVPKNIAANNCKKLTEVLLKEVNSLVEKLNSFSEQQLDEYILPHPLLGKLTLREMLYFTMYHVQHHHKLIQNSFL